MHKADTPIFMDEETIDRLLTDMEKDSQLRTAPVLVKDAEDSVKLVTFREVHAQYLRTHPKVNPQNYLANLHAMIKIRP